MKEKTELELKRIIENRLDYDEGTFYAALKEYEKRRSKGIELSKKKIEETQLLEEKREKQIAQKKSNAKPGKNIFVTLLIVFANILVFGFMVSDGVHPIDPSIESLIRWGGNLKSMTLKGEPWRLLTSTFAHSGVEHLVVNMYVLVYIGLLFENKIGKSRYFFTYLFTSLVGSIASLCYYDNIVSVGASGGVFGMFGVVLSLLILNVLPFSKKDRNGLITSMLFYVAYNLFDGFTAEYVDNAAHVGGLLSGIAIGFIYYPSYKQRGRTLYISIALLVVLSGVTLLLPKVISDKYGEFNDVIDAFATNENNSHWMYSVEFSNLTQAEKEKYCLRIKTEGIDLWKENIKLLRELKDLPPDLHEEVGLLIQYSRLRMQVCVSLHQLLLYNKKEDQYEIDRAASMLEQVVEKMDKLHQ